jgi:hypothetical protein
MKGEAVHSASVESEMSLNLFDSQETDGFDNPVRIEGDTCTFTR